MVWTRHTAGGVLLVLAAAAAPGSFAEGAAGKGAAAPGGEPRLDGFVWPDRIDVAAAARGRPPAFGAAVAVEGDVALIGAPSAAVEGRRSGACRVVVRTLIGGDWLSPPGYVLDPGPVGDGARFGAAIDLGHGIAAVGAPGAHGPGGSLSGIVRVFAVDVHTGRTRWLADLAPPPGSVGAAFGSSVAVGRTASGAMRIAVGAPRARSAGGVRAGSVLVFERAPGGLPADWRAVATLDSPTGGIADDFGASLCLAGDLVVVGAPGTSATAPGAGAAYGFDADGLRQWSLAPSTPDPLAAAGARYGTTVRALAPDRLAVAAFGRAAVEVVELKASGPGHRALLRGHPIGGFGLAVAGDADEVWVGAPFAGSGGAGAVHRFVRAGNGYAAVDVLHPDPPTAAGEFGLAIDVERRDDGSLRAVVGEPASDHPCPVEAPRCASGRAVVYRVDAP
ncbi:MAG: hypothetical protein AAF726_15550 [Planctomycetota bacterium]